MCESAPDSRWKPTCEQLVVEQPDLVLEDLLLDSPQRALHLLPPRHHVGQVTNLVGKTPQED